MLLDARDLAGIAGRCRFVGHGRRACVGRADVAAALDGRPAGFLAAVVGAEPRPLFCFCFHRTAKDRLQTPRSAAPRRAAKTIGYEFPAEPEKLLEWGLMAERKEAFGRHIFAILLAF